MNIATVIFSYNRVYHIKRVLDSLARNTILPEKLFIFQDGPREGENIDNWKQVNKIITDVDWCDCEVIVAEYNKGLRRTIVDGINYVLESYDAVVVIEDDCITHPLFMDYMYCGLHKYKDYRCVYSINGYTYDIDVAKNGTDAYFTGRASSWGWGTWKNRWKDYKEDYEIITRIKSNNDLKRQFHYWGEDLESYLYGNIEGRCNSWAVFWGLIIIEKGGYCLTPYKSLVSNIGFDGSGQHCGNSKRIERLRDIHDMKRLHLPDQIEIPEDCLKGFSRFFAWTDPLKKAEVYNAVLRDWINLTLFQKNIGNYLIQQGISKVSVWGLGSIGKLVIDDLLKNGVDVLAVILSRPNRQEINNIPIVGIKEIPSETQVVIVIPVYDLKQIIDDVQNSLECPIIGIDMLLHNCYNNTCIS